MSDHKLRQRRILELLQESGGARVSHLSQVLGASEATIRRDLDDLAETGHIERTHGGALLPVGRAFVTEAPDIYPHDTPNLRCKQQIASVAATLIQPGDSVFLGAGSTTFEVARCLHGRTDLTVITNSLPIMALLAREPGIAVVSTGGLLRSSELCFLGHIAEQAMHQLRPQKVVMGIRALSLTDGLTSDYLPEVPTDRAIIESAREVILVADHTKFGKAAPAFVAPVNVVTLLVTDAEVPADTLAALRGRGIQVLVA